MEERQVTVVGTTHAMAPLFMVMATQNPIEQEGTYPLPEAQMDRFVMNVRVDHPSGQEEVAVIAMVRVEEIAAPGPAAASGAGQGEARAAVAPPPPAPIPQSAGFAARAEIGAVHVSAAMARDMADIVQATRTPAAFGGDLARWIVGGRARGPRWRCAAAGAPMPGWPGATMRTRRICAPSPPTCCATAWA